MTDKQRRDLAVMMWNIGIHTQNLSTSDSRPLTILNRGTRLAGYPIFEGAEIVVGEKRLYGSIQFLPADNDRTALADNVVLCVGLSSRDVKLDTEGREIALLVVEPPVELERRFGVMLSQPKPYDCGYAIAKLDALERLDLYNRLYLERLKTKCEEVEQWFERVEKDWNRTLYVMLFRTFGESQNKDAYTMLAERVPVEAINRERDSIISIEALLLGTSGLLDSQLDDRYTITLKEEFDHLSRKYSIRKMNASQWDCAKLRHDNQPVNRLATLSMLLHTRHYMFDMVMKCRTVEDLHKLFCVEASEYWSRRTSGNRPTAENPKRIGIKKAELMGVNFVAVMQFTYGQYVSDEEIKSGVVEFMERIPAESNTIIDNWKGADVKMENSYDAQAMLQLHKIYCHGRRCSECLVGKKIIKEMMCR